MTLPHLMKEVEKLEFASKKVVLAKLTAAKNLLEREPSAKHLMVAPVKVKSEAVKSEKKIKITETMPVGG